MTAWCSARVLRPYAKGERVWRFDASKVVGYTPERQSGQRDVRVTLDLGALDELQVMMSVDEFAIFVDEIGDAEPWREAIAAHRAEREAVS